MSRRGRRIAVVVATREAAALALLDTAGSGLPLERREALTTGGVYRALEGAHLVVANLEQLVESPDVPRKRLESVLAGCGVPVVDGASFAADPHGVLAPARWSSGLTEALPSRSVGFTALAGGVGKTTLALSLARYFRRRTGLPVVVAELSPGPSPLLSLAGEGDGRGHLYEVVSQGHSWPVWDGVTLAPMDWETARLLPEDEVAEAWHDLRQAHVLTIFDGPACHPLWPRASRLVDAVFVVADGRPDALAAAVYLLEREEAYAALLNRSGAVARLSLGAPPAARIPDVGRAASHFPTRLGRRLASLAYPGWRG